jgi:tetratricopeptide (TPR) repeat protein
MEHRAAPQPDITARIQEALTLHQQGHLEAAKRLYDSALASDPNNFDVLHLMGVLRHQQGASADALRLVAAALDVRPGSAEALTNYGVILDALKRHDEALAAFEQALAVRPADAAICYNRGLAEKNLGRHREALASFELALSLAPGHVDARYQHGNTLAAMGRHQDALVDYTKLLARHPDDVRTLNRCGNALMAMEQWSVALAAYDAALAVDPSNAETCNNRGVALLGLGRSHEALESCDRALAMRSGYTDALYNRGNALLALKRFDDARSCYEAVLACEGRRIEALNNLGLALGELGRPDEALARYDDVLARDPDHLHALHNRANALLELERFEEALAMCDRALAADPAQAEALNTRGVVLGRLGRHDDALATYDRAIALTPHVAEAHSSPAPQEPSRAPRPGLADAHFNSALCHLLLGDFARGWQEYEWRWKTASKLTAAKRNFAQPLWRGAENIAGKTILLHAEQGYGDTLQFCRYVPLVADLGAGVILEVPRALRELMRTLPGAARIICDGDPLPAFDLHCPLLSLPLAFDTQLETIPAQIPYLFADETKRRAWRDRLGKRERPRVGLVWAGDPRKHRPRANRIDRQRSLEFDRLAPILQMRNCEFYSLQKGDDAVAQLRNSALRHNVVDWSAEFHDFSDTAALIANLDLVITVDTAVAHLAGALGKPLWLLNRHNTCWRWLLDRDDSPWYPAARLFRQDAAGVWDGVIARVQAALTDTVQTYRLAG